MIVKRKNRRGLNNLPFVSAKAMAFTFSLIACWPASAFDRGDVIEGTARVIDGDTLDVAGVRVRLNGNRN